MGSCCSSCKDLVTSNTPNTQGEPLITNNDDAGTTPSPLIEQDEEPPVIMTKAQKYRLYQKEARNRKSIKRLSMHVNADEELPPSPKKTLPSPFNFEI